MEKRKNPKQAIICFTSLVTSNSITGQVELEGVASPYSSLALTTMAGDCIWFRVPIWSVSACFVLIISSSHYRFFRENLPRNEKHSLRKFCRNKFVKTRRTYFVFHVRRNPHQPIRRLCMWQLGLWGTGETLLAKSWCNRCLFCVARHRQAKQGINGQNLTTDSTVVIYFSGIFSFQLFCFAVAFPLYRNL